MIAARHPNRRSVRRPFVQAGTMRPGAARHARSRRSPLITKSATRAAWCSEDGIAALSADQQGGPRPGSVPALPNAVEHSRCAGPGGRKSDRRRSTGELHTESCDSAGGSRTHSTHQRIACWCRTRALCSTYWTAHSLAELVAMRRTTMRRIEPGRPCLIPIAHLLAKALGIQVADLLSQPPEG
jgi:hypothetical protein